MSVSDFLEKYQNIYLTKNDLLNPYGKLPLNQSIYNKKEFNELQLSKFEDKPESDYYNHQKIISRFLSSKTNYPGLLLFHEPGTGKSCSAFATTELIRKESTESNSGINKGLGIKRALILVRGKALEDNLKNELVFQCTKGEYIPEDYENLSDEKKIRRLNKSISSFYTFETFEVFAKSLKKMNDSRIRDEWSNTVIVIDEVHNLRLIETEDKSLNIYEQIHRFLHVIQNCKVLLMSGTPMKDQPNEIASILNLILPSSKQMPTGSDFDKEYLEEKDGVNYVREDKVENLKNYFVGKVSYLRSMHSDDVKKEYVGKHEGKLKFFKVELDEMSPFQGKYYKEAYEIDVGSEKKSGIYSNSRQASLFVFPDGTYGSEGYKKYIIEEEQKRIKITAEGKSKTVKSIKFKLSKELADELSGDDKLEKLKKFSTKYYKTIKEILDHPDQNCFVYNDLVEGSGSILFSKILDHFGITNKVLNNRTSLPKTITKIIKEFNKPENKNGKNIRVIVGSQVISEGFTLNNIQQIHIHTPHWNYSETEQAIARGIRLNSHQDLIRAGENVVVRIFQHASVFKGVPSIDLKMYLFSETKDLSIKNIERYLKESAFDCELNKERNLRNGDFTRDCEYTECDYTCDDVNIEDYKEDLLTYNLFYSEKKIEEIKESLRLFFNKNFYGTFEELKNKLKDFTEFQILSALSEIINNKIIIKNPYGLDSYLAESDNIFYLTNSNFFFSNFTDNFYNKYPILKESIDFDQLIDDFFYQSFPSILDKIIEEDRPLKKESLFRELPLDIQELILETAIQSKDSDKTKNKEFRNWVLNTLKNYIYEIESAPLQDKVLISNLSTSLRCYRNLIWNDCSPDLIEKFKKMIEEKKEEIFDNEYGYAGIIDKEGTFKIRDVLSEESKENVDKRKETRGKKCESWEVNDLMKIIGRINLEIPSENEEKMATYSFKGKEIEKLNKKELLTLIKDEEKFKKLLKDFSISELEQKDNESLRTLVFWYIQKKSITCKYLKKWFENQGLIQYSSEETKKKTKK